MRKSKPMRNLFKNAADINTEQKLKDFEALVFPLMDRLYSTALSMTKSPLDAEDLVQNTYLKAFLFFHQFEPGTNFRGWMFRILTNNFINEYRIQKKEPARVNFETTCAIFPQENTSEFDGNRGCNFTENYEELFDDTIATAFDKLPKHYRIVVLLSDVNGLKYKEIAELLNCPIGTVMSRINRGRQMLARSLKRYAATNGFTTGELSED